MYDIGIIGCGAATVTFLASFISEKTCNAAINIVVFDKAENFGNGSSYKEDYPWLNMNSYARGLSVYYKRPDHFIQWLNHKGICSEYNDTYVPSRNAFRQYLKESLLSIIKQARAKSVSIKLTDQWVKDIDINPQGYQIITSTQRPSCKRLIISTGVYDQADVYNLKHSDNYIHNPYPLMQTLPSMPAKASVGILGSNMTASDIIVSLRKLGYTNNISIISRSGFLPTIKPTTIKKTSLQHLNQRKINQIIENGPIKLLDVIRPLIKEFRDKGMDWRAVFSPKSTQPDSFKLFAARLKIAEYSNDSFSFRMQVHHALNQLLPLLKNEDLNYFRHHFMRNVMRKNGSIPIVNAQILHDAMQSRVEMLTGVESVTNEDHQFIIKTAETTKHLDIIFNATGPIRENNQSIRHPLIGKISKLLAKGTKSSSTYHICANNGELIFENSQRVNNVHVIGYPAHVKHIYINCFDNISEVNFSIAQTMLREMSETDNNYQEEAISESMYC